ncbi:maleylpyruvate isomerase family mycothiol-dependent enzyme [Nocardia sp. NPDC050710]|uniref:maleylpyruvate isomerase family mycothiol-dependent enzyme n=1 Tax=Nocardia sp. NPDC050710 TaxID=3157220 RepID=UPI0033EE3ED4
MTTTNTADLPGLRRPALPHADAMRLAATEYDGIADAVEQLAPQDWNKPTDCTEWSVHQLISHVVGMAAMAASPLENLRQNRIANKRPGGEAQMIDALTALQVRKFGTATSAELTTRLRELGPRAAAGRRRTPGLIRGLRMPGSQVVGGIDEKWSLGYLIDIILTRDPWMHRIDLSRATGHALVLTADHDGRIVDDVVREWAGRHGRPYRLIPTGPAGGTWSAPAAPDDALEFDAIEFCRILSGRGQADGLLATVVPF